MHLCKVVDDGSMIILSKDQYCIVCVAYLIAHGNASMDYTRVLDRDIDSMLYSKLDSNTLCSH